MTRTRNRDPPTEGRPCGLQRILLHLTAQQGIG
jgi:hypothetical protein